MVTFSKALLLKIYQNLIIKKNLLKVYMLKNIYDYYCKVIKLELKDRY